MVATLFFFFFNDTATTEIYTLSLHDALPIFTAPGLDNKAGLFVAVEALRLCAALKPGVALYVASTDRKSTRLNSSHRCISYAVFCLKKKKRKIKANISKKSKQIQ